MSHSQNSARIKCYFHYDQNWFLDYFEHSALNGAIIYEGDVIFQWKKWEHKYTEFVGNLTGIISVATNRVHEFLLNQKCNAYTILNV